MLRRPAEKESSVQRTVDWFRFWLKDEEREGAADDPERYLRWRALRQQHRRNERWLAEGLDPAVEFLREWRSGPAAR
jgi:hypothetical protein